MKTWLQSILLFREDKQQVVTNGYLYLYVGSIAGGTVKGLDMQVLLDILDVLEKELNLPSFSIKFRNSYCINRDIISDESAAFPISKVIVHNESKVMRILLRSIKSCKLYRLIGYQSCLSVNFFRLSDCVQHVILGSGDKPRMVLMKVLIERLKLHVAFIHKIVAVCHNWFLSIILESQIETVVNIPFLFLVRLCKCRFRHFLKSRPIQVLRTKIKSSLNITQATVISELRKVHYHEQISAIELYNMPVSVISLDVLAKFILSEERFKLHGDCFAFINYLPKLALIPFLKLTSSN